MGVKETEVFLLPVRSFSPSSPNGTVERRGAAAAANTRMVDVTDKPQIVEHVNKSLSMTVYETKWIPSSARFVLLGSPARQTGMLQIYQLNGGSIELEAEVERPKSFKCGTLGATKVSEREESEQRELFRSLWLFSPLVKTRPMGRPWDNGRAKRWWAHGRHVRQKEPAPSAEVRRATQQAVHAPPTRLRAPAGES